MERTYIKDLKQNIGKEVVVKGFVQAVRDQGGIKFLILRDVTGTAQCVVLKSDKNAFNSANDLTLESVISVDGSVEEEKQARLKAECRLQSYNQTIAEM